MLHLFFFFSVVEVNPHHCKRHNLNNKHNLKKKKKKNTASIPSSHVNVALLELFLMISDHCVQSCLCHALDINLYRLRHTLKTTKTLFQCFPALIVQISDRFPPLSVLNHESLAVICFLSKLHVQSLITSEYKPH